MSQSSCEVASVQANQITAVNLSAAGSDSGAKRSLADSDDEESPAGKRFSAEADDTSSNSSRGSDSERRHNKLKSEAAPAANVSENLGSKTDGGSSTEDMSQTIEHNIPDRLVGLMIGKGGESINRLQEESGARIQISTESSGSVRQVTLTGTQEQVDRARQLMDTIVQNAERGSGDSASHGGGGGSGGGGGDRGAGPGQETVTMQVPSPKVGLLIGKAGETIKSLQDKAGVRMLLVQDASTAALPEKPLKIIGPPERLTYARELVLELLNSKDAREFPPGQRSGGGGGGGVLGGGSVGVFDMRTAGGMGGGGPRGGGIGIGVGGGSGGGSNFGETYQEVKVPRRCVGVVIGKGGDMLRKINQETGAKVQFRQEGLADRELPERMLQVSGSSSAVQSALERVQHLITAVMSGEIPVTDRPRGPESRTVTYAVPAEKAGLVIGKGGETVKEINRMSGAYVAIQRDAPPNGSTKVFDVQGSSTQIAEAIRLICEKAGLPHQAGAFYGNGGAGGGAGDALTSSGQETLPAPQFNNQTGQMDYSLAWAEYYRRQGMHEYADAILRQAGGQQPQQQPPQDQQWQQWQQWQAWQQNGGQQAAAGGAQQPGQQAGGQQAGQQPQQAQAWGAWQQAGAGGAAGAGGGGAGAGGWDGSAADPSAQAAAWGQQAQQQQQQQPDGGQQQNWWYGSTSGR